MRGGGKLSIRERDKIDYDSNREGRRPGCYCDSPPQKWGSGIYNNGFSFIHLPFSIAFSRLFLCEIALGSTSIVPNGRIRQICIFCPLLAKVLPLIGLGNFDPLVDRGSQNWSLSDHNWKEEKWWLGKYRDRWGHPLPPPFKTSRKYDNDVFFSPAPPPPQSLSPKLVMAQCAHEAEFGLYLQNKSPKLFLKPLLLKKNLPEFHFFFTAHLALVITASFLMGLLLFDVHAFRHMKKSLLPLSAVHVYISTIIFQTRTPSQGWSIARTGGTRSRCR